MLRLWTVDAFTETAFCGNPAAVCIIEKYDESLCQRIAMEMNLSETAFLVPCDSYPRTANPSVNNNNRYYLRWWTPATEVQFCGHATLASAHLLFSKGFVNVHEAIQFETKYSGTFTVSKPDLSKNEYLMNFPALSNRPYTGEHKLVQQIMNTDGITHIVEAGEDLLIELERVDLVAKCMPNISEIVRKLGKYRCILITAKANKNGDDGDGVDFQSRVFAPSCGVNEDPVTGSAHAALGVYWSERLNKSDAWLRAYQASKRGGYLKVKHDTEKDRILMVGSAVTVSEVSMMLRSKL